MKSSVVPQRHLRLSARADLHAVEILWFMLVCVGWLLGPIGDSYLSFLPRTHLKTATCHIVHAWKHMPFLNDVTNEFYHKAKHYVWSD